METKRREITFDEIQQEILILALVNSGMVYVLRDIHANHIDVIKTLIPDVKSILSEQMG